MKRQLERLKGKRLVTGDANLMTKDEICINTTSDGGVEVKYIGVDGKIKDLASSSSSNFPYRISYFKVNNTNWASLVDAISIYYPIIVTINLDNGKGEIHLVDRSMLNDVRIFTVIDWDIVAPEYTINLDFVFKSFEGKPEVDYVEEITQEEYNTLRSQL